MLILFRLSGGSRCGDGQNFPVGLKYVSLYKGEGEEVEARRSAIREEIQKFKTHQEIRMRNRRPAEVKREERLQRKQQREQQQQRPQETRPRDQRKQPRQPRSTTNDEPLEQKPKRWTAGGNSAETTPAKNRRERREQMRRARELEELPQADPGAGVEDDPFLMLAEDDGVDPETTTDRPQKRRKQQQQQQTKQTKQKRKRESRAQQTPQLGPGVERETLNLLQKNKNKRALLEQRKQDHALRRQEGQLKGLEDDDFGDDTAPLEQSTTKAAVRDVLSPDHHRGDAEGAGGQKKRRRRRKRKRSSTEEGPGGEDGRGEQQQQQQQKTPGKGKSPVQAEERSRQQDGKAGRDAASDGGDHATDAVEPPAKKRRRRRRKRSSKGAPTED